MSSAASSRKPQHKENVGRMDSNDETENITGTDDDSLLALYLRFKFQDQAFPKVWRCLRDAGWIYRNGPYQAPDGQVHADAGAVCEYLDQWAVADVYSNLQPNSRHGNPSDENEQALRQQVINHWYERGRKKNGPKEPDEDEDEERFGVTEPLSSKAPSRPEQPRRSTRAASTAQPRRSVTSVERGSDIYLHKHNKRGKPKRPELDINLNGEVALEHPTLKECAELIKEYPIDRVLEIEKGCKDYFSDWRFLLSTNHSLLLFGAGSKRMLLNEFCQEELYKEGYALIINGYDPDVKIQGILDLLVRLFLDGKEPDSTSAIPPEDGDAPVLGRSNPWRADAIVERAIAVGRSIAYAATETLTPVFLCIHNLEGEGLRNTLAQEALSSLLVNSTVANGVASIRLVASVDHVDASMVLWSVATSANFGWIWKEVHTHRPYVEELIMLHDEDVRKMTSKRKDPEPKQGGRVLEVLKNLAPRYAEIVQILARLQSESSSNEWVDYLDFRDQCKNSCAILNDRQLKTFMMELIDHRLVAFKRDETKDKRHEMKEWVRVPHNEATLRDILAFKS
jgi:origin recognition complex subunit 2